MRRLFRLLSDKLTEKQRLRKALKEQLQVCADLNEQLADVRRETHRLREAAEVKPVKKPAVRKRKKPAGVVDTGTTEEAWGITATD